MVRVIQRQWVVLEEREGGLPPGSPEACAAIERVRRAMNPDAAKPKTQPAWSIKEPDSPEFRTCEKCGAAVRGKALCKPCSAEAKKTESRDWHAAAYEPLVRWCQECSASITGFPPRSIRCVACQTKYERRLGAERRTKRREEAAKRIAEEFGVVGETVSPIPCKRCEGPIIGKGKNSQYCASCREIVTAEGRIEYRATSNERRREQRAARRQVSA